MNNRIKYVFAANYYINGKAYFPQPTGRSNRYPP
jgi:hypothetical protein